MFGGNVSEEDLIALKFAMKSKEVLGKIHELSQKNRVSIFDVLGVHTVRSIKEGNLNEEKKSNLIGNNMVGYLIEDRYFHVHGEANPTCMGGDPFVGKKQVVNGKCPYVYFPSYPTDDTKKDIIEGKHDKPIGLMACSFEGEGRVCYITSEGKSPSGLYSNLVGENEVKPDSYCKEIDSFCPLSNNVTSVYNLDSDKTANFFLDKFTEYWGEETKKNIYKGLDKIDDESNIGEEQFLKHLDELKKNLKGEKQTSKYIH